jgi:hypothetical protein
VEVEFHPEAQEELLALPEREQAAIKGAIAKLVARGPALGFPYSSAVRGADRLRELRPRAGRSRWRALYRQIGQMMWVGAVGPEAEIDRLGFARAIRNAERRLASLEGKG